MAGLYIHIPFCKKACYYCNFHFTTDKRQFESVTKAIIKELQLQANYLPEKKLDTIYFGGGTPSFLPDAWLEQIIDCINRYYDTSAVTEYTVEGNPDDLSKEKLRFLKQTGCNRLSIGIQSFFDDDLTWMNRAHTAKESKDCIENARVAGFEKFNIDLIYALPDSNNKKWIENLQMAIKLGINHLSCYGLTLEEKTPYERLVKTGRSLAPNEHHSAEQFELAIHFLENNGWEHYEISNFCLPGNYAAHNTGYWKSKLYLGVGPGSHSFNGKTRQWNIADNKAYVASIEQNIVPFEMEFLGEKETLNEKIMTGLRTKWGLPLSFVSEIEKKKDKTAFLKTMQEHLETKNIKVVNDSYVLTLQGKLMADYIMSSLMFV